jgi:hypothetical protein
MRASSPSQEVLALRDHRARFFDELFRRISGGEPPRFTGSWVAPVPVGNEPSASHEYGATEVLRKKRQTMPAEAISIKRSERYKSVKSDPTILFTSSFGQRVQGSHPEHEQMLIGVLGSKAVYQIYPGSLTSATM